MSFSCIVHGWFSRKEPCPICCAPALITTGGNESAIINHINPCPQCEEKESHIKRLEKLLEYYWKKQNPHTSFFGDTDGELYAYQERIWQKFKANNL